MRVIVHSENSVQAKASVKEPEIDWRFQIARLSHFKFSKNGTMDSEKEESSPLPTPPVDGGGDSLPPKAPVVEEDLPPNQNSEGHDVSKDKAPSFEKSPSPENADGKKDSKDTNGGGLPEQDESTKKTPETTDNENEVVVQAADTSAADRKVDPSVEPSVDPSVDPSSEKKSPTSPKRSR